MCIVHTTAKSTNLLVFYASEFLLFYFLVPFLGFTRSADRHIHSSASQCKYNHNTNIWTSEAYIVPTQVERNARRISYSKSLRGTLFKPRRHQLVLVILYKYISKLMRMLRMKVMFCSVE